MKERFLAYGSEQGLWQPGDRVLAAVSGGIDSMVMLDLFLRCGMVVGVAHANFGLRGDESVADEAWLRAFCKESKIPFHSRTFDTKNYAGDTGLSIQMAARKLRYAWFDDLVDAQGYHFVATAHHLNDNLETFLLRVVKGADLPQLAGIPPRQGHVIRPMLFATRKEIEAYAAEKKIRWREDSSNATDDYPRNFIRHKVVPLLRELNPSLEETFARSMAKLAGASELMERGLGQLRDSLVVRDRAGISLDKNLLMLLRNPAVVCHECLREFGFEWDVCFQLVRSLGEQPGKIFQSPTHDAVIDREKIIVRPRISITGEILIEEGQDQAALGPWKLTLQKSSRVKINSRTDSACIDLQKVKFPLHWRKWQSGDVFIPLGLGRHKKVSDLLVDEKVPLTEKQTVTVLLSQEEIIWVVGYRLDDRYRITEKTQAMLELRASKVAAPTID